MSTESNPPIILNAKNVDAATAQFADNAVIQTPSGTTDQTRNLGIGPLDAQATIAVQDGKITSFTVTYTPESLAKLQAAQVAAQPNTLPVTGGNSDAVNFGLFGLLLLALGGAIRPWNQQHLYGRSAPRP